MQRIIYQQLKEWRLSKRRKPLILLGARQVGKTYSLKHFGKSEYEYVAYINCDENDLVKDIFAKDFNMERILLSISAITETKVVPEKTLIILDEIQELKNGLASLKYFCENVPEYHVVVAGSLLGIAMHKGESFPVGKVNIMKMFPMNFEEFLMAKGRTNLLEVLKTKNWETINSIKQDFIQQLREYYFVGGMPEAVKDFVENRDIETVREIQQEILFAYNKDISKHAPKDEVVRIHQVWASIPSQLAKENKKFIFGVIKKGARARDFEIAIQWLLDAGLVYKVSRVNSPGLPLSFYEDMSCFKLYMLDCGLMGCISNTPSSKMLIENEMKESKGAFTENYVASQLVMRKNLNLYYYSKEDSSLEIDFIVQYGEEVIPIEVKSENNVHSKSLKSFISQHPELRGLRFSMTDYASHDFMENVPLFAVGIRFSKTRSEDE